MKKVVMSAAIAFAMMSPAVAADMPVKAAKAPPAPANPWEIAFGAAVVSDYNFRGISQSDKKPSVWGYFEPRYNITSSLQAYAGIGYESIKFPNNARSEVDLYAGIRPTFGPVSFDFGYWYYWYPGGSLTTGIPPSCTNGSQQALFCNFLKANVSFSEIFGKATWNVTDAFAVGANVFYAWNWLNSGASGTYGSATAKYTLPSSLFPADFGMYVSGELGRYWLGTTDAFYGSINLPDYTTWNLGIGFTYKVVTLDLRYYDTDLSRGNCNVLTGDGGATFSAGAVSAINNGGESKWCRATFIAKLAVDFTIK